MTIERRKTLTAADTAEDFARAAEQLVGEMFGKDALDDFTTEVFNAWSLYSRVQKTDMTSREKLMQLLKIRKGTLQKLVGALLVTTPHSMATERAVSHYNIIRSTRRQAMIEEMINNRLLVSANGVGTLH